jgi:hypothetical protein
MESRGHSVLDTPLSRSMTTNYVAAWRALAPQSPVNPAFTGSVEPSSSRK